jgi:fructokinase
MKTVEVACFGEVLWDIFQDGDHFHRVIGGAIANAAVDLARAGIRSSIVGGIGRDPFGDDLEERVADEGVETRWLVRLPERTGLTFITRDARGEPTFLFYRQCSADMAVAPEHIAPGMARAKWVLVGSSTLPRPELAAATWKFIRLARKAGAGILVDLNVRPHLWKSKDELIETSAKLARFADVVKGSVPDIRALGGPSFLEKHAPRALCVITDGAKPARAWKGKLSVTRPALRTKCVDATGGGDAFVAGLLAALVRGRVAPKGPFTTEFLAEALDIGHTLGKKAVSKVGAVTGLVGMGPVRKRLSALAK